MWYIEKLHIGTSIGIVASTLKLKGKIHYNILEQSVNRLIEENDAIRIKIYDTDGIQCQYIEPYKYRSLDIIDFSTKGVEGLYKWDTLKTHEPFVLTDTELYYFALLKLNDNEGGVFIKLHHIVSDAWSFVNIVNQIVDNYSNILHNTGDDHDLLIMPDSLVTGDSDPQDIMKISNNDSKPSYLEYIENEKKYFNSSRFIKDKAYWDEVYRTVPDYTTLKVRKSDSASTVAKRKTFRLSTDTTSLIRNFCKSTGTSIFSVFWAALAIYLNRKLLKEDVIFGTPVLNRGNVREKKSLGMFITNVPIRTTINNEMDFLTFSDTITRNWFLVLKHQKYPYNMILKDVRERFGTIDKLYDILISYQNAKLNRIDCEMKYEGRWHFNGHQVDSLYIHINDRENEGNFIIDYDYLVDTFLAKEIEYIHSHLINIIQDAVTNPWKKLYQIEFMDNEEKERVLFDFNNTRVDFLNDATIHRLFEIQVEKTPDATAVVFHDSQMTYRELNARSNQAAWLLRSKDIRPDDIVGVMMFRSLELPVAILGVLKSGAAYLPIDPELPTERISFLLNDSGTKVLVTQNRLSKKIDFSGKIIEIDSSSIFDGDATNPPEACISENLVYVMYTSGSTGTPKGAMIEHKSLVNFVMGVSGQLSYYPGETVISISNISFDSFLFEIFPSLLNGMKIVIADEEQRKIPGLLRDVIEKNGVGILLSTPSTISHFLDDNECLSCFTRLRKIIIGGEIFTYKLLSKLREITKAIIYNSYGPAECTVGITIKKISASDDINIGKPIQNTRIYILDNHLNPVPVDVPGELYIAGLCLARGYINRPELNSERFLPDPFNPGERMYKTGDLARWYPKGDIEFLGRIDYQLKIRGIRVEPGEIESELLKHNDISKAVVLDKTDKYGKKYLCAYIVSDKNLANKELRAFLSGTLPAYMIPKAFVNLDDLPLTPSGKVNRIELPEPNELQGIYDEYEAPSSDTEEKLACICAATLHHNRIGVNDNFFELGGDSLSLISISTIVQKEFGVDIPLTQIYDGPTVKELAGCIGKAGKSMQLPLHSIAERPYYPVSPAQKRIYLLTITENADVAYNMPWIAFIEGTLDTARIEYAFNVLIKRHESFRTSFELISGMPVQIILSEVNFNIEYSEKDVTDKTIREFIRPFNFTKAPLLRVGIYKVSAYRHLLLIDMHHIISDGYSIDIMLNELDSLYSGKVLPEKFVDYKDYSVWCDEFSKTPSFKEQEDYWLDVFSTEAPVTEFTTDYARPSIHSFKGSYVNFSLGRELTRRLKEFAFDTMSTVYIILLAAYNILLSRYTGHDDIVVGSPVAGRNLADLDNIIGMFVNTLPIRNKPCGSKVFMDFLKEVRSNTLEAFENQDYPLDVLVSKLKLSRDLSRNPLFNNMFILQKPNVKYTKIGNMSIIPVEIKERLAKFELSLEAVEKDGDFTLLLEYCTDLFKKETAERICAHYKNILYAVISNPLLKIAEIDMLSKDEKQRLIFGFNDTSTEYVIDTTIDNLFLEQVKRTPDSIALAFQSQIITYKELNEKSNRIAWLLKGKGLLPDDVVAVMMFRSPELLASIIGILKAGGAYLPIDPDLPDERILYLLTDSGADILMTQDIYKERLDFSGKIIINITNGVAVNTTNPPSVCKSKNLAYIMYTSGSTGTPKGVMIEHKSLVNFVKAVTGILGFQPGETAISLSTMSFDSFIFEIFPSLLNGMKIVLADEEQRMLPGLLYKLIDEYSVEVMYTTPSIIQHFLEFDKCAESFSKLKKIVIGGEVFTEKLFHKLKSVTGSRIYNSYGPAETTVAVTLKELTVSKDINIGKPFQNTYIYILDENLELVPIGVPGEICIGGECVARGYINVEYNFNKFVPNPFIPGNKIYRTGDLARWLPCGNLEFLGRIDHQIKIRGLRIEPCEIENELLKHKDIKKAAVIAREDNHGRKYLCAYVVSGKKIMFKEYMDFLSGKLPAYMIPTAYVNMEDIPLTINGKIDRNKLLEYDGSSFTSDNFEMPSNEIEQKLVNIWMEVLKTDQVSVNDNFFELGGDSLLVLKVVTLAYNQDIKISIQNIYRYQTIRQIFLSMDTSEFSRYQAQENTTDAEAYIKENVFTVVQEIPIKLKKGKRAPFKNVLLTGSTGFLGCHILYELINNTDVTVYCLIRSKSGKNPKERLYERLSFYFGARQRKLIEKRTFIIEGDIRYENFGLSRDEYKNIGNKIDIVVHSAATVKHYGDASEFEEINVQGAAAVLDFAMRFNNALYHISTTSVSQGFAKNNNYMNKGFSENDIYTDEDLFENIYVKSKYMAEKLISKATDNGFDASIIRVGNLTGRYSDGCFQINISENAFYNRLKAMIELGAAPVEFLSRSIDLTPVDLCSNAILKLLFINNPGVFHLYNHNLVNMNQIIDVLNTNGYKIRRMQMNEFSKLVAAITGDSSKQTILGGIVNDLVNLDAYDSKQGVYSCNCALTLKYLKKAGFIWPQADTEYLTKLLNYMRSVGYIYERGDKVI